MHAMVYVRPWTDPETCALGMIVYWENTYIQMTFQTGLFRARRQHTTPLTPLRHAFASMFLLSVNYPADKRCAP